MTTSTTYDLLRIAAIPGSAGAGAALHLEAIRAPAQDAESLQRVPAPRRSVKKRPALDPVAVHQRACAAMDKAETMRVDRPTFVAAVMRVLKKA